MENKFYTGYKDRKEKKIFVGDIIMCLHSGREYKAIYDAIDDEYYLALPSGKVILSFNCFKQEWLEKEEQ